MIHPLLATISKEKKPCYLSGDFNINLLSINNNPEAERFFDKLTERQFMPLITVPTRIAKTSKTLIDNIFYNQFSNDIVSGNLTVGISDHMPQFCIVPSGKYQSKAKANNTFRRNFKNFNAQQFSVKINSIDWTINDSNDFNEFIPTLINTTEELLDQMAPLSRLTNKQIKQRKKPWINHSILDSIRKKDTIYKKSISETNIILKQQYILDYKKLKNEITKNIRSSKKAYYQAYFLKIVKTQKKCGQVSTQLFTQNRPLILVQIALSRLLMEIKPPLPNLLRWQMHLILIMSVLLIKSLKNVGMVDAKISPSI